MNKNILQVIVENHGQLNASSLARLANEYPNAPVCIKWAKAPREIKKAKEAFNLVNAVRDDETGDYTREVFVCADNYEKICECLTGALGVEI